jgi:hypothetical protein
LGPKMARIRATTLVVFLVRGSKVNAVAALSSVPFPVQPQSSNLIAIEETAGAFTLKHVGIRLCFLYIPELGQYQLIVVTNV